MKHELKTDSVVFEAALAGLQTHNIRLNDRNFQVGDEIVMLETRYSGEEMREGAPLQYTGRSLSQRISHVMTGYGLQHGWCILSFDMSVVMSQVAKSGYQACIDALNEAAKNAMENGDSALAHCLGELETHSTVMSADLYAAQPKANLLYVDLLVTGNNVIREVAAAAVQEFVGTVVNDHATKELCAYSGSRGVDASELTEKEVVHVSDLNAAAKVFSSLLSFPLA